jgi:hypothetical protein
MSHRSTDRHADGFRGVSFRCKLSAKKKPRLLTEAFSDDRRDKNDHHRRKWFDCTPGATERKGCRMQQQQTPPKSVGTWPD